LFRFALAIRRGRGPGPGIQTLWAPDDNDDANDTRSRQIWHSNVTTVRIANV
jgi:hypothetical protein